jgi:hypothetical protein
MSYSKKATYQITKKLYRLMRNHSDHIHFQKLYSNVYGSYNDDTKEIRVDYRRDIIPTLIHEALHHWYPDWNETKVRQHESFIINALTQRQIRNIIKVIAEII